MQDLQLSEENVQDLELFKNLLAKDKNTMINEALRFYFKEEAEKIEAAKNSETNLSYDEFWDDVDL